MRYWVIILPNLSVNAMAIYPFILLKDKAQKQDIELINHEQIHHRQQLELLLFAFYFFYLINYLFNLFKYRNHYQAYYNICFEREAYKHENDLNYLTHRKWYNWINFYSA